MPMRWPKIGAFVLAWSFASVAMAVPPSIDEPPAESEEELAEADALTVREEIVVTATASERRSVDVPYSAVVVEGDDLRQRRMARTLPESMGTLPGVMVQKTAHGQGSPFIRGFTGFRNLFLVDGIRLNNSVFRDGPNQYWATVDSLALERLELVKGPVSVLYGSDAIGGTVNAVTRSPLDLTTERRAAGRFHYRFASAEHSHVGRLELMGQLGSRFRYQLGGSWKSFGELEAGGSVGTQPKTDYDEWDADFKGVYQFDAGRELVLGFQRAEIDDAWRTHRTIFGVPFEGTTIGNEKRRSLDQGRRLGYVRLRQTTPTVLFDDLEASLSHHRQQEERFRIRSDDRGDRQGFDVVTTGLTLRLGKALGRGHLTYGFELHHDDVDSFSRRFSADGSFQREAIQGPVADDATYDLLGFYVQHELTVGERLRLLFGGRYNRAEADARRVADPVSGAVTRLDGSWDQAIGNFRALYRLGEGEGWHLFGGVSQGFRAPNLSDLTRLDSARSNEIETPSPDLDAENFLSYEVGLKTRRPGYAAELTFFHTVIDGMIVRVPTGREIDGEQEITKLNAGDGFTQGVEVNAWARLGKRFTVSSVLTWLDGEVDTFPTSDPVLVREPIDRLMPLTGHLSLRYDVGVRDAWLELLFSVAEGQDRLSTRDRSDTQRIPPGGTPGYEVLTLRGGLALGRGLELQAALENLTDTEYRIHGSGLNQAGRNLILSLDVDF